MPSTTASTRAAPLRSPRRRDDEIRDSQASARLAFISPDPGRHPVGSFLVRVLENLRQEQYETICYSYLNRQGQHDPSPSSRGYVMVRCVRHERPTARGAGPYGPDRHPLRPRRPYGPQSIAGFRPQAGAHPNLLDRLQGDHRIVGNGLSIGRSPCYSRGRRRHFREKVLRMPDNYLCYDPPESAHFPASSLKKGLTFGSFNNLAKISPEVVALWATRPRWNRHAISHEISRPGGSNNSRSGSWIHSPTRSGSQRLELQC